MKWALNRLHQVSSICGEQLRTCGEGGVIGGVIFEERGLVRMEEVKRAVTGTASVRHRTIVVSAEEGAVAGLETT